MERILIEEIERITNCKVIAGAGNSNNYIDNITTDTRNPASSTTLYIPIIGPKFNGRDYMQSFLNETGGFVLDCQDGKKALGDLARSYRSKFSIPIIAITGSSGKTSTKEMISAVVSSQFNTIATIGNLNNDIGAPLTLFRIDKSTEVAILELGMNNFGEISYLSSIVRPNISIFTNIGTAHIGNLGSREGILKAKLELLDYIAADGIVVLNADDDMLSSINGKFPYKLVSFGINNKAADIRANKISEKKDGIEFEILIQNKVHSVKLKLYGKHHIYNALAAITVGIELKIPIEKIITSLSSVTSNTINRQKEIKVNGITIIDDCYNANKDSMIASLTMLKNLPSKGNKYAVLGDMFELGEFNQSFHKEVSDYANSIGLKKIFTIGESSNKYIESHSKHNNIEELFENIKGTLKKDDIVLIKASHSVGLEKLVKLLQESL